MAHAERGAERHAIRNARSGSTEISILTIASRSESLSPSPRNADRRRALAIREKVLGPNHPHARVTRLNLAELERARGKQTPDLLALDR